MFDLIARVLAFFYELPVVGGSVGYAIILLTAAVMMLLMPLTVRATRSTIKMQEVQPQLKALQKKHRDDKQTLNQELMALYQQNGINPIGGCLPMLAQLPVFLVLFNVLRGLSRRVSDTPYFALGEEARSRLGGETIAGETFDPQYLSSDSALYRDLSSRTEMSFGPFDLALEPWDVLTDNFLVGIPYVLLILFVVATSFYQQRQVSARRGGGSIGMNAQQEMILKFLPLMTGIWSFYFPAGLVLYWATSNVFRIGQQSYITRRFYGAEEMAEREAKREAIEAAAEAEEKKSGSSKSGSTEKSGSSSAGNGSSKKQRPPRKPRRADSPSAADDVDEESVGHGSGANGAPANGVSSSNGDRNAAWERRRQEKSKAKAATKNRKEESSRVTPKGTKPAGPRKKRKR